jgi:outer membrane immunogenic protein
MKKILGAALLTAITTGVNAQSVFQGFYGQLATGYESNSVSSLSQTDNSRSNSGSGTYLTNFSASSQTFGNAPLVLGLGYNFSVAPKWLLGLGVDYSALSQTSSNFSQTITSAFEDGVSDPTNVGAKINGNSVKVSNRVNIFVAPSYEIDKDKLLYLKAGYSMVNVKYQGGSSGQAPDGSAITGFQPLNGNKNVSGFLVGLGYKQVISGGLYGFAEGNYMSYGKANISSSVNNGSSTTTSSVNPSLNSYQLLVGIGYRF